MNFYKLGFNIHKITLLATKKLMLKDNKSHKTQQAARTNTTTIVQMCTTAPLNKLVIDDMISNIFSTFNHIKTCI